MFRLLSALLFITIITGCEKETHPPQVAPPVDLLTNGKWLLTSYGWDDDSSGVIEDKENLLTDCEKDNTIQYFSDGKGQTRDNQLTCTVPGESMFEWKFIDDEKAIEILFQRYEIENINSQELHLKVHPEWLNTPFLIRYRKL